MKFDSEVDYAEWIATTYGIIKAFEDRGYALYELGPGPMMFGSVAMIQEFIQYGRAKDVLQCGTRYMLMPLVKDSKDSFQVFKAVDEMVKQMRAPYFFNCKQNVDGSVEVLGKHLIDSVAVEPPFLEMSVDVRFAQVTTENTIEIPLVDALLVIRKQVMMALRGSAVSEMNSRLNGLPSGPLLTRKIEV